MIATVIYAKQIGAPDYYEQVIFDKNGKYTVDAARLNEQLKPRNMEYVRTAYIELGAPNFAAAVNV